MPRPNIDTDECVACGACVDACPMGVIEIESEVAAVIDEDSCIACDACVDSCPTGAILEVVDE